MMVKSIILGLASFFILAFSSSVFAQTDLLKGACTGKAADGAVCQQYLKQKKTGQNPVVDRIQTVTNIFALLTGVAAVIVIIYGGFVFVTAGGSIGGARSTDSPTRAKQARAMVTGAVIGLVIVALGWTIVTFVTNNLIQ